MRSRPTISVVYSPRLPRGGDTVRFEVRLQSRSDTPVDALRLHFTGKETRVGAEDSPFLPGYTHCDQHFQTGRMLLRAGERLALPFELELPKGVPPSFESAYSRIEYRLETRVDIPWWPDRTKSFVLRVGPSPVVIVPGSSAFLASAVEGPRGKELHVELTVAQTKLELGGEVSGALSVENAQHHPVKRLELAVVVVDSPVGRDRSPPVEVYRSAPVVLVPSQPRPGVAYPFALALPSHLPPSFVSQRLQVRWLLEARAVISLRPDVVLLSRLQVAVPRRVDAPADPEAPARAVPPMGRERRALVWARTAAATGLSCDAEGETMTGTVGPVALTLQLEMRDQTLYSVATLAWPGLGLDVDVTERRWTDAFAGGVLVNDARFDKRLTVRGREPAQVRALLEPGICSTLLGFERIALDDDGAVLASPGNGYNEAELGAFARTAIAAAQALGRAIERLPVPAGLGSTAPAWEAFAKKVGGRFEAGGLAIREVQFKGAPVELVTRFDEEGKAQATIARALRVGPKPLTPEAERLLASLAKECTGLNVADDAIEATLPCPLEEPARAEALWRALTRVAQAL